MGHCCQSPPPPSSPSQPPLLPRKKRNDRAAHRHRASVIESFNCTPPLRLSRRFFPPLCFRARGLPPFLFWADRQAHTRVCFCNNKGCFLRILYRFFFIKYFVLFLKISFRSIYRAFYLFNDSYKKNLEMLLFLSFSIKYYSFFY